ncbi:hypothetical protein GQ42DRAFT_25997 [Ramicandelaber brevisporus]|nr:hypothetical protein GQ42DRAFT_25997 [Ramicandelaber brevisporus]
MTRTEELRAATQPALYSRKRGSLLALSLVLMLMPILHIPFCYRQRAEADSLADTQRQNSEKLSEKEMAASGSPEWFA